MCHRESSQTNETLDFLAGTIQSERNISTTFFTQNRTGSSAMDRIRRVCVYALNGKS